MTAVLVVLLVVAAVSIGAARIAPPVLAAIIAAALVDAPILRARGRWWAFPDGAVLTGLFVAMVLSPFEPWWVSAATSAIAIASKYVLRTKSANIFNPAALALVISYYAFNTGQSWWGALPELMPAAVAALFISGIFITDRVNKMPLVLAFLGVYYALFTATAYFGDAAKVAEIFRAPDLHAVLYFAFFMLTDPPTAPIKYQDQIFCGALVAVVSYALFETVGVVYYLLAGLMVGNVWEAWRRVRFKKLHTRVPALS